MDRDFAKSKIRQLIAKPYMLTKDLEALYTIILALPLPGSQVGQAISELADMIDHDLKILFTEKGDI